LDSLIYPLSDLTIVCISFILSFKTYLLNTFRYFRKQKGFTLINLLGLTLVISCSLFIFLWVQDEVSTDQFYEHREQIYGVMANYQLGYKEISTTRDTPYPLEKALENDFPEIVHVVSHTWNVDKAFRDGNNLFKESGIYASEEFSQDFMKLILIAFLIAIPVTYYVFSDWLEQYAYRIDLSWWLFAMLGLAVILLALLVIGG
jgi:uncharacterized membrane protein YraQ (UPF0718 family)